MPKYSFETIEQMLLKCVAKGGEPELGFRLRGTEYMIIAYADRLLVSKIRGRGRRKRKRRAVFRHAARALRRAADRRMLARGTLERGG